MTDKTYIYKGNLYPGFLKTGDAAGYIRKAAQYFCEGDGLDIGAGPYPLPGAMPLDLSYTESDFNATNLPNNKYDYIFSSHCLEHLPNYVEALEIWQAHLKPGGCLFLYLPHPEMEYWLPQNNKKHLHEFEPKMIVKLLQDLGFKDIISSERDIYWSFAVVGFKAQDEQQPETD